MNAVDKFASLLTLTREPFPASTKSVITGSRQDLRVPVREVLLTNGERVSLYDTSGPYTDPAADIDVRRGLPGVRMHGSPNATTPKATKAACTSRSTMAQPTPTATPQRIAELRTDAAACSARRAAQRLAAT